MKVSAGLLMYRRSSEGALQVLLAHPGGPFFAKKDAGAWSLPKGLTEPGEDLLVAARREFHEETGFEVCEPLIELGSIKQKGGKQVHAWAFEGDCDPSQLQSNSFELEWPPRSGKKREFPEIDRAEFFGVEVAREKLLAAQVPFIDRLLEAVEP